MVGNIKIKIVDMLFQILMGYDNLDTKTIKDINDIINKVMRLKVKRN